MDCIISIDDIWKDYNECDYYDGKVKVVNNKLYLHKKCNGMYKYFECIDINDMVNMKKQTDENGMLVIDIMYTYYNKGRIFKKVYITCKNNEDNENKDPEWILADDVVVINNKNKKVIIEKEKDNVMWYDIIEKNIKMNNYKYIFIINPVSGNGNSQHIFYNTILPVIDKLGIKYYYRETLKNVNTYDILKDIDMDNYNCIIGIGGDGTINDIYQALLRLDRIDYPVSCIPTGSGNALATSMCKYYGEDVTPLNCLYNILKGSLHDMKLSICKQHGKHDTISFLSQSWGFASEVDIDSEVFRCFGDVRFTLTTLYKLISLKNINGTIHYLPYTEENKQLLPNIAKGDIHDNMASQWEAIPTNEYTIVWACQLPWMGKNMLLSPKSDFDDDIIYLNIIKNISRLELLNLFKDIETGKHINHSKVQILPVLAYKLIPYVGQNSYITVDGEKIDYIPLRVSLLPTKGKVLF